MADGEADLDGLGPGRDPADIAGRKRGIGEAMKEARIDPLVRFELDLDAGQEALVRGEAEMGRDARAGAVGADEIAGGEVDSVEADERAVATGALEAGAAEDRRAGVRRLLRHPAQEVGGARW